MEEEVQLTLHDAETDFSLALPLVCISDANSEVAVETNHIEEMPGQDSGRDRQTVNHSTTGKSGVARENSAFQLIADTSNGGKMKCKVLQKTRKSILTVILVCAIGVLCTMTALYISERQRRVEMASVNTQKEELKQTIVPIATVVGTTNKAATAGAAKAPLKRPMVPHCLPFFDAHPIPTIPREIQKLTEGLNADVEKICKSQGLKAVSVAFSYRGKIWWSKHSGKLNYSDEYSPLPNNDTPYPISSITKLFTTFMLHKLFENGKLRLDDQVQKHLPEFSVKNPFNNENITLRQLSSMMSGLPRESPCYPGTKTNICPANSTVMWERIANLSLILPPDKTPSYSNLGFSVLGHALERIAGEKYDDWIMRNIIKPLGMTNSGFNLVESAPRLPVSTNADGSKSTLVNWGWQLPAAGLYSSINDLNQVAKMLFEISDGTSVLHKTTARNLFKPAYLFSNGHGIGYGLEIYNTGYLKPLSKKSKAALEYLIYARNGATVGYGSWIALVPRFKFAAFVLTAHSGREFAPTLFLKTALKALDPLEKVLIRSQPKYVLPPSMESYIGKYKFMQHWPLINGPAMIFKYQGKLYLRLVWYTAPLSYESPWVLVTGHYKQYPMRSCEDQFLNSGLAKLKLYFRKPSIPGGKSPGFHVFGFAPHGWASFRRVN